MSVSWQECYQETNGKLRYVAMFTEI